MFDIGFPELILIAIVGLLVIGPKRLPEALRSLGLWFGRMRRSFNAVKAEIEKEIGMDEVKRQLHNEAIMDEMKRIEAEVRNTADTANAAINSSVNSIRPEPKGAAGDLSENRQHDDAAQEPDTAIADVENTEAAAADTRTAIPAERLPGNG